MSRELQTINQQNKLALWAGRISECRNSGMAVKTWCKENGICEQTYYKWQRRLLEMAQAQQEVQFAEVTPLQPVRCGSVVVTVRIAQNLTRGLLWVSRYQNGAKSAFYSVNLSHQTLQIVNFHSWSETNGNECATIFRKYFLKYIKRNIMLSCLISEKVETYNPHRKE